MATASVADESLLLVDLERGRGRAREPSASNASKSGPPRASVNTLFDDSGVSTQGEGPSGSPALCLRPVRPYGPGALETLLAAFEKRPRRTFLRKKSAMMMAIARKPSRIAYSVVVWPSSRSRSSCTHTCSAITGRIRMSVIWRFLLLSEGPHQPLHVTDCPSDFVGPT